MHRKVWDLQVSIKESATCFPFAKCKSCEKYPHINVGNEFSGNSLVVAFDKKLVFPVIASPNTTHLTLWV